MMRRTIILFPLVVLIFAWLLSACAPAAAPSQAPEEVPTEAPAPAEEPAATEAPVEEFASTAFAPRPTSPAAATGAPAVVQPHPLEPTQQPASGELPLESTSILPTPSPEDLYGPSAPPHLSPQPTLIISETKTGIEPTSMPVTHPPGEQQKPTGGQSVHQVNVEWPAEMRLGDTDTVVLTLVPSEYGFMVVAEYPEHQVVTQTVTVQRLSGHELFAVARLDSPGFEISPGEEQSQYVSEKSTISWRWAMTPRRSGQQRLALTLALRWLPLDGASGIVRESTIYSKSLDVRVHALLGLTRAEALRFGMLSLLLGCTLGVVGLASRPKRKPSRLKLNEPNISLAIETSTDIRLPPDVRILIQALFQRYSRVVIEQEFLSGYSGARTLLALPVRADGRVDAYTIAKIGERRAIEREYENYETFVKDTLPPVTARIQHPPVSVRRNKNKGLAALQYTFIGEPGKAPVSLRRALLAEPDGDLLRRLMDTFGPNWWLQRAPYVFHAAVEYDRQLPSHLVITPDSGHAPPLDGRTPPARINLKVGDRVQLRHFSSGELRQDQRSLSLQGQSAPGNPPLRVRWLSTEPAEGSFGKVVATREMLLANATVGCSLFGLPDPLEAIPELLQETITGCQSTIHGDLNLENLLIGPGGLIWLIDFASTRNGHTMIDFAHLTAEIIAHILAPQITTTEDYLSLLSEPLVSPFSRQYALIQIVEELAGYCLFNPTNTSEFDLSLILTCLGALKYSNLDQHARHLLLLTAAFRLAQRASIRAVMNKPAMD